MSLFSGLGNVLGALSPIELFHGEQFTKIKSFAHKHMAEASGVVGTLRDAGSITKRAASRVTRNVERAVNANNLAKPGVANSLGHYMSGYNIGSAMKKMTPEALKFNSIARRSAAGALGLYVGSKLLLGNDNPISNTIGFGASAFLHGSIAKGLYTHAGKGWGIAYAGISLFNMIRS